MLAETTFFSFDFDWALTFFCFFYCCCCFWAVSFFMTLLTDLSVEDRMILFDMTCSEGWKIWRRRSNFSLFFSSSIFFDVSTSTKVVASLKIKVEYRDFSREFSIVKSFTITVVSSNRLSSSSFQISPSSSSKKLS